MRCILYQEREALGCQLCETTHPESNVGIFGIKNLLLHYEHECGLAVMAVCLGANVAMAKTLGCQVHKQCFDLQTHFPNPMDDQQDIFMVFDTCHGLRLLGDAPLGALTFAPGSRSIYSLFIDSSSTPGHMPDHLKHFSSHQENSVIPSVPRVVATLNPCSAKHIATRHCL